MHGKKFEEWSRFEFPTLLDIVKNNTERLTPSSVQLNVILTSSMGDSLGKL